MASILASFLCYENRFMLRKIREKKSLMKFRMPSLNAIRVFEVAARHLSFARAADELCVTHGAVGRQIRLLEESLGTLLFERRNRAVFLTREGLELQKVCAEVMQRLEDGIRTISKRVADSPLVVSCEPTIAMRWLIPRLPRFHAEHPDIRLLLFAAGGSIDFAASHVDLALRRNDFNWRADYYTETVGQEWVAPVCSPSLLQNGRLELAQQCLLHSHTRPHAWQQWAQSSGQTAEGAGTSTYEHFYLSLQAASAGLGVAIGSIYMVEDDLAAQRLCAPFGFVRDGSAYVLLSPSPFAADDRRLAFLAWLRAELQATQHAAAMTS